MINQYIWDKVLQGKDECQLKILASSVGGAREIARDHLRERYGRRGIRKGDLEKEPKVVSKARDLTFSQELL